MLPWDAVIWDAVLNSVSYHLGEDAAESGFRDCLIMINSLESLERLSLEGPEQPEAQGDN